MAKKKLMVFKLDTCILCTLLAPLNNVGKEGDEYWQILNVAGFDMRRAKS